MFFRKKLLGLCLLGLAVQMLSSCNNYKQIPYFKDLPDSTYLYTKGHDMEGAAYQDLVIQQDDVLQVTITTLDPSMTQALGLPGQMDLMQDPLTVNSTNNANSASRNVPGYIVDKEGYIELPLAGKAKVAGLTTSEAKELIRQKALQLYRDPVVNLRLANFKITVLGEVQRPGSYLVTSEKVTLLDALGLAGDMTIYGKRENVLLVRREGKKQKMVRFDLNSTEPIQSPYFYLKQGDVLYVEPGKGKAAATDASLVRTYGIIASTLSLLIVIATRIN